MPGADVGFWRPLPIDSVLFGPFVIDVKSRTLKCRSRIVHLSTREFDLLWLLASASQSVVTKDEIIRAVWRSRDVADYTVTQAIYRLRKILADHDPRESYIVCARSLGYQFTRRVRNEQSSPDVTDAAFRRYQQALSCRTTAPDTLTRSIGMLESALQEEPYYLDALIAISEMYVTAAQLLFLDPSLALNLSERFITRALRIEPSSSDAHAVRSNILLLSKQNIAAAADAASSALIFDPDSQRAQAAMVWALIARNNSLDAIAHAKRLLRAAPASADVAALFGIALYYSGAFAQALVPLYDALELDRTNGYAQNYALRCLCAMERYGEASQLLQRTKDTARTPYSVAFEAYIANRNSPSNGRTGPAASKLGSHRILKALVSLGRRDVRGAQDHMNAAANAREPGLALVSRDPLFQSITVNR